MNIQPTQTFIKHAFLPMERRVLNNIAFEDMYTEAERWVFDNFTKDEYRTEIWFCRTDMRGESSISLVTCQFDIAYYAENIAFANEEDFVVFKLKFGQLLK